MFVVNNARKARNYDDIRSSEVESRSEALDESITIAHSNEVRLRKSLVGGKLEEPENVANLLEIAFVRVAVGANCV